MPLLSTWNVQTAGVRPHVRDSWRAGPTKGVRMGEWARVVADSVGRNGLAGVWEWARKSGS